MNPFHLLTNSFPLVEFVVKRPEHLGHPSGNILLRIAIKMTWKKERKMYRKHDK